MNKLLQTTLVTAIMATSGFASSMADLQNGGEIQAGGAINFNNETLTLSQDKSLDVYGSLTGTGTINCSGDGKVNVYEGTYKPDTTNAEAIKTAAAIETITDVHTIDDTNSGSIAGTIIVNPQEALNKVAPDLADYASGLGATDLVYVANSEGTETKCVGGTGEATTIPAALANAATDSAIEGLTPTSLLMENKLKFTGNNSGFNQKAVRIGTTETPADVEYAGENSVFLAETTVESGSKLTISSPEGVTLTKNLTVNGLSSFKLNENQDEIIKEDIKNGRLIVTGKLIIGPGTTLTLGKEMFSPIADNPSDYPKVMTWPDGSFANPLTEVNKNYYTLSFNDGSSLKFYYDEDGKYWNQVDDETNPGEMMHMMFNQTGDGGLEITTYASKSITKDSIPSLTSRTEAGKTYYTVSLGYDKSVEIYEDPDNPGQYKTDNADWTINSWDNWENINISSNGDCVIKLFTADEVAALTPYKKDFLYAHDGTFSYSYDSENDSWVRRNQKMIFQPGSIDLYENLGTDNIDLLFELPEPQNLNGSSITHIKIVTSQYNESLNLMPAYLNGDTITRKRTNGCSLRTGSTAEGTKDFGYFANGNVLGDLIGIFNQIDTYARTHTFAETWMTLDEYNAAHGTSYTWAD